MVIRKTHFEQSWMLNYDYQSFGQIIRIPGPEVHATLKDARFLLVTLKDACFSYILFI